MLRLVSIAIIWSLSIVFSAMAAVKLLIVYITKFTSQPWKLKQRPNAPACLSDPKYGTHKIAEINVSGNVDIIPVAELNFIIQYSFAGIADAFC